jgi:hypothetical protein
MATALENVPLSDKDAAEAEALLRQLSAGQPIHKVRTGTLPPLSLTISGPGPKVAARPATAPKPRTAPGPVVAPKRKKKKKSKALMAAMMSMMVLTFAGGGWAAYAQSKANKELAARQAREQAILQARADSLRRGSKVIVGLPEGTQVEIDFKPYRNGDRFEADTGRYAMTASISGFQPLNSMVVIESGRHDTLRVPLQIAQQTVASSQRPGVTQAAVVRDSQLVRFTVAPLHAEILVDNVRIGAGRAQKWLSVGNHTVRFTAVGCTAQEQSVTAIKGEMQIVPPVRLTGGTCGQ